MIRDDQDDLDDLDDKDDWVDQDDWGDWDDWGNCELTRMGLGGWLEDLQENVQNNWEGSKF